MAVVALTSASGSPGVTATAVALALAWPRPVVLVDADPTGGSAVLAGFLRGVCEYEMGLVEIALSPLGVDEALRDAVQPLGGQASFVAGTRSHTQAAALKELWAPLSAALADLEATGQDVIVDAGRLGLSGSPQALLSAADLTLLVTRTDLPSLAASSTWAETVREPADGWSNGGLLLIGAGQPYKASDIAGVLGLPVMAELPDDPTGAAVYHRGAAPAKRFETSGYVRAVAAAATTLVAQLAQSDQRTMAEVVQ